MKASYQLLIDKDMFPPENMTSRALQSFEQLSRLFRAM
jgi:hypothetical protein